MNRPPEFQSDVLDAIAVLTDRTPGDVFYKIEAGEFQELAIEALLAYAKKYRDQIEEIVDSGPMNDVQILEDCLSELESELAITTDAKTIRDLKLDIESLQQRIQIAKSS